MPVRYTVVGFMVLMAGVTYLDRVAIATLAPQIMRDLNLSKMEMSFVFSAFTLAYALFEVPTAWWGERAGTRKVLTRIVAGLNEGADQVNDAAGQVSISSQQLAEGASEQASSLEETSSALEEMAQLYLERGLPLPIPSEPAENIEADLIERMPLSIEVAHARR